jgi:hypothetical protein
MWMMRLPEGVRFADEDAITPTVRLGRTPLIVAQKLVVVHVSHFS